MVFLFSLYRFFIRKRNLPFYFVILVFSCAKMEDVDIDFKKTDFPSRTLMNADIVFKDSGFIKIHLLSPLIKEYAMLDSPFTEFPKGVRLKFYTQNIDSPGFLRADWAYMSEIKDWYEGRGNVVVISEKGDTLKTQKLFWNKKERKIFTEDTVFIITKTGDSLQANSGLEAKDDLSEYHLFNNRGAKFFQETNL